MTIILCGLPKTGKTTVGKLLASKLMWDFIDTDQLIEQAYFIQTGCQQTCRQIYVAEGEKHFRLLEKEQIVRLRGSKKTIIALGGGVLCDQDNVNELRLMGNLIYLKTPVQTLWRRIEHDSIPAYLDRNDPEKAFYTISERRIPLYEKFSHHIIETAHLTEEAIAAAIINATIQRNVKDGQ